MVVLHNIVLYMALGYKRFNKTSTKLGVNLTWKQPDALSNTETSHFLIFLVVFH